MLHLKGEPLISKWDFLLLLGLLLSQESREAPLLQTSPCICFGKDWWEWE